nr:hypothetical protein [uncultured Paludibaculum sp.]
MIGRSPDRLTLVERRRFIGLWVALELYTPETLPLRRIEAVGRNVIECARQLKARGLDPGHFEFVALRG